MTTTKRMLLALLALIVSIVYIVVTFRFRRELGWWAFADCFALFMMIFTWLMSLLISRMVPHSGQLLSRIALFFGVLFVIALVVEYFVYSFA